MPYFASLSEAQKFAILKRCRKEHERRNRETVYAALEAGRATVAELVEACELPRDEVGKALDQLRIAGSVEWSDEWERWQRVR